MALDPTQSAKLPRDLLMESCLQDSTQGDDKARQHQNAWSTLYSAVMTEILHGVLPGDPGGTSRTRSAVSCSTVKI